MSETQATAGSPVSAAASPLGPGAPWWRVDLVDAYDVETVRLTMTHERAVSLPLAVVVSEDAHGTRNATCTRTAIGGTAPLADPFEGPNGAPTPQPSNAAQLPVLATREMPSSSKPFGLCEGHCRADADCAEGLVCSYTSGDRGAQGRMGFAVPSACSRTRQGAAARPIARSASRLIPLQVPSTQQPWREQI